VEKGFYLSRGRIIFVYSANEYYDCSTKETHLIIKDDRYTEINRLIELTESERKAIISSLISQWHAASDETTKISLIIEAIKSCDPKQMKLF